MSAPGQPAPQLPPGWVSQWDQSAGRNVYIETATGRTSWQPPLPSGPGYQQQQQQQPGPPPGRPTHPQGQARMSMPPMAGPPNMRAMPPSGPGPQLSPQAAATSPPPTVNTTTSSRRRAYPTAHLAANSVSYSGGFPDAGNLAPAGYPGASPGAGAVDGSYMNNNNNQQQPQQQLFTPAGAPDALSPQPTAANLGAPSPGSGFQPSHYHSPSAAPAPGAAYASNGAAAAGTGGYGGGVAGMTNQFQSMGVGGTGGTKGVSSDIWNRSPTAGFANCHACELFFPLFRTRSTLLTCRQPSPTSMIFCDPHQRSSFLPMPASPQTQRPMQILPTSVARSMLFPRLRRSSPNQNCRLVSFFRPTAR